jgi:hypothetical protein
MAFRTLLMGILFDAGVSCNQMLGKDRQLAGFRDTVAFFKHVEPAVAHFLQQ